jgi:hypothetical protein
MSPTILGLQDAIMGIQGEHGAWYLDASYVTIHGGLKNLEEDIRGVQEGVDAQLRAMLAGNQVDMGALKFDTAQASVRSMEVKRWMEQTQATGGGTAAQASRMQVLKAEIGGHLRPSRRCFHPDGGLCYDPEGQARHGAWRGACTSPLPFFCAQT